MKAVYSVRHILHHPPKEFNDNQVMAYGESPERAELIYEALLDIPEVETLKCEVFDENHFAKAHSPAYLDYLENAYQDWVAKGLWKEGIMPEFFAIGSIRGKNPPSSAVAKAGYFMTDNCSMIIEGTWEAVKYSAFAALTGARLILDGEKYVFSLCRPPGHHAGYDFAGGYCFLNNSAIAALYLQNKGNLASATKTKVGIFDIDFHHGNGTQDIVGRMENIFLISIHGHPDTAYPYFTGYTSENSGNITNFPLLPGITDEVYFEVFKEAIKKFKEDGISYLVLSLGVDTFEHDHQGNFKLTSKIYSRLGEYLISELNIPVLIVMEGGYNAESLATNVVSFLKPFINAKP